jgi:dihydroxyacetone kinase
MSVGSALSHVHIPNHPLKDFETDEYLATEQLGPETGLGEHQLPGSHKLEVDLPGIVQNMLKELLDWSDEDRSFSMNMSTDQIVLMVNNLGGLSGLELAAITLEIALQLEKTYDIKPVRAYSGTFMSSLNEFGFSISLLKVIDLGLVNGMNVLDLLDAPSETTRWPVTICPSAWKASKPAAFEEDISIEELKTRTGLPDLESELPRPIPQ